MVSWTDNELWSTPLRTDICGYVSDRFIPCQKRRPCPIHDCRSHAGTQESGEAFPPEAENHPSPSLPAPRLLEEEE